VVVVVVVMMMMMMGGGNGHEMTVGDGNASPRLYANDLNHQYFYYASCYYCYYHHHSTSSGDFGSFQYFEAVVLATCACMFFFIVGVITYLYKTKIFQLNTA